MRKRMLMMLAIVIAVVAVLAFVKFQQISAAIKAGGSFQPPPEAVTTVVAKDEIWPEGLDAVGSVAAAQGVMLSADLPGVVSEVRFQSGTRVQEGQTLVVLDTRQERAQLAAAEAAADLARTNLERSQKLLETKVIAQSEFDQVAAQAKQAAATADIYRATIARKTIRAPFSGMAGIRTVNVGQYVQSGDPIVPLQAVDPVYVDFSVPQQQVSGVKVGAAVEARADTGARALATGRITAVNPVVDAATRNVQVQATFRNADGRLRPGSYVTVRATTGGNNRVIALPSTAINFAPYGNSVFIVEEIEGPGGKPYKGVRQQFVQTGAERGDQVAILSGVQAGQEIVTSGVFKLRPGAAVTVDNTVKPSNSPDPKPEDS